MPNLPRAAMLLLLLCYISESSLASAASRGYYPLPDSSAAVSSGSEEGGMIRGVVGDEETSSTSSEMGYDPRPPLQQQHQQQPSSLTFGQQTAEDGDEANGPERKMSVSASRLGRPTQEAKGGRRNEVFIFDLPKEQNPKSSSGMELSEEPFNDAIFQALDRKYENAKSSSHQGWPLYPSKRFGKMHSYSPEPELYRPVKRNLSCMRKCMAQGFIHPVQCHSLC